VQFDLPGALGVAAGRYLAREGEDGRQSVLVVETFGAPAAPGRRRQRAREAEAETPLPALPLTRATAIRAHEPFGSAEEASSWLEGAVAAEEEIDALVAEGARLLNRALHAQAVAGADPRDRQVAPDEAVSVRIGVGSGEEVAAGHYSQAREVDVRGGTSRRRRRDEELRPQERVAAVLGGRERPDACETLLLRARADLDGGRPREAALQLRAALEALLVELSGALADPGHEEDMAQLEARRQDAVETAKAALRGDLDAEHESNLSELTALAERVLRRRRVLRG
jgi:hypothetical protein